jgi:small-conductance mechanosensitive channel
MKKFLKIIFNPEGLLAKAIIAIIVLGAIGLWFSGHLTPVIEYLDSQQLSFKIGGVKFTAYELITRVASVILLLWCTSFISGLGQEHIRKILHIRASNKALVIKTFQIILYVIVFFISLNILNINLSALAVLGGAVGIGVGFGLQKIASNFISGLILLFEKSVEEGNLIELTGGITGFVKSTGARYTLIESFDGKEIMVPNEDFITGRVTNFTYSTNKARVEIPIGVSYNCDLELARNLMLEAAFEHPRCSKFSEPACYLIEFGNSSVNFVLHFWVDNVIDGRLQPKSEIMFAIWKKFKSYGIEIPYPQMDIHMKNIEGK